MLSGIDVNQRIEFISSWDTTEPKTVFVFKPLAGFEMIKLSEVGFDVQQFLEKTIVEIVGVADKSAFLNSLSVKILGELINKANEINKITEQETKN